jgi:hypothetical protein
MVNKDKAGFFMLDAESFKRLMVFDVWEDEGPETENLDVDVLPNPSWLRRSEDKPAAPEAEIEVREKRKSAA